eukprot:5686629-Amphidinium_carterae.4
MSFNFCSCRCTNCAVPCIGLLLSNCRPVFQVIGRVVGTFHRFEDVVRVLWDALCGGAVCVDLWYQFVISCEVEFAEEVSDVSFLLNVRTAYPVTVAVGFDVELVVVKVSEEMFSGLLVMLIRFLHSSCQFLCCVLNVGSSGHIQSSLPTIVRYVECSSLPSGSPVVIGGRLGLCGVPAYLPMTAFS